MTKSKSNSLSLRFVPMGTNAPAEVPEGEIWLDVGGRVAARVLDHHGGDTDAWSAAQLVQERYSELILGHLGGRHSETLVLHADPDLDAIFAAWLVRALLANSKLPEPEADLDALVRAVSENDQGLVRTDTPEDCWPIVMRTLIGIEYSQLDDEGTVRKAFEAIDKSWDFVRQGMSLKDCSGNISTPSVEIELNHARTDYLDDLSRATIFQVKLPADDAIPHSLPSPDDLQEWPDPLGRWILVDAIHLDDPVSSLFKELARGDKLHSPMKQGFTLLVVSWDVEKQPSSLWQRYVISTDPFKGLHLKGLGQSLERLERERKEAKPQNQDGRNQTETCKEPAGTVEVSPWYDGRGHGFTIVDSPALVLDGRQVCAS
ncbi:MAG: hypothetical protein JRF33_27925, partial [Deltaproteobacteria bacterium]|nr:hypothetical protein [Deltaproteobacteria bacterium]